MKDKKYRILFLAFLVSVSGLLLLFHPQIFLLIETSSGFDFLKSALEYLQRLFNLQPYKPEEEKQNVTNTQVQYVANLEKTNHSISFQNMKGFAASIFSFVEEEPSCTIGESPKSQDHEYADLKRRLDVLRGSVNLSSGSTSGHIDTSLEFGSDQFLIDSQPQPKETPLHFVSAPVEDPATPPS